MATYLKMAQRRSLARAGALELLAGGTLFQNLSLKDLADHLGWPLGTLHRAYSVTSELLNDMLLEYEDRTAHAVYAVGRGGLAIELAEQAERMQAWMADPANVQLLRYQMALGCRSEDPVDLPLRRARGSSWGFHRDVVLRISVAAGEEYSDLHAVASMVAALRDGTTYQFFSHGELDRWLADNLRGIAQVVGVARPRKVRVRSSLVDQRWIADQAGSRRRALSAGDPD